MHLRHHSEKLPAARETVAGCSQVLYLDAERGDVGEALFRPSILGIPGPGVAEMVHESILSLGDSMSDLGDSIVLTGMQTAFLS